MIWTCYKCGHDNSDRKLVSVHAPGFWFICEFCIADEEEKTGMIAVLSYSRGLFFTTKEEAEKLTNEEID